MERSVSETVASCSPGESLVELQVHGEQHGQLTNRYNTQTMPVNQCFFKFHFFVIVIVILFFILIL